MRGSAGMPRRASRDTATRSKQGAASLEEQVRSAVTWLKRHSTKATRDGMARYGVPSDHALGVSMADMKVLGKRLGTSHELAAALVGHRHLRGAHADLVCRRPGARHLRADGSLVSRLRQLGHLRYGVLSPVRSHAPRLAQGRQVARPSRGVRQARGLCAAGEPRPSRQDGRHDALFLDSLPLIERAAADERNFVKKGVSWALRADRQAQPRAERGLGDVGAAPGVRRRRRAAVGRQGRASGVDERGGHPPACGKTSRRQASGSDAAGTRTIRMTHDTRLVSERFPRSSRYHPDWVLANASGGANSLWLAEWLAPALESAAGHASAGSRLRMGLDVDLSAGGSSASRCGPPTCGSAPPRTSSASVMPASRTACFRFTRMPGRCRLPRTSSTPSCASTRFRTSGTDDLYLNYLAQFVKPGGPIGVAGASVVQEIDGPVPEHLRAGGPRTAGLPFGGLVAAPLGADGNRRR